MKNNKKTLDIKKIKKEVKGITLIALVVTIIVLLILAGVAINLTIGQNGIFKRAELASNKWNEASLNEQKEMDKAANFIDDYINGKGGGDQVKVEDVIIPKGFYYVGGTKSTGIVISDNSADNGKYTKEKHADQANIPADGLVGNQFVWVPVEKKEDFRRYKSYWNGSTQSISSYHEPSQEGYRYPNEEKEYNDMLKSVEINKGFYVARFEAGKGTGEEAGKVVSKKGASVWNKIPWGKSMTDIGTDGAVAKAKGMYTDKNTHAVTSTLIYGVQWDAIMAWIDPDYKKEDGTCNSFVSNSTGKGNHEDDDASNNPATCGSSDAYRVNNIYDLAGNVFEWTMEANSTDSRVNRGGSYSISGSNIPASGRNNKNPDYSYSHTRFPFSFIFVILNAKAAVYVEVDQAGEKAVGLINGKKMSQHVLQ